MKTWMKFSHYDFVKISILKVPKTGRYGLKVLPGVWKLNTFGATGNIRCGKLERKWEGWVVGYWNVPNAISSVLFGLSKN